MILVNIQSLTDLKLDKARANGTF